MRSTGTSSIREFPFIDAQGNTRILSDVNENQTAFCNPEGWGQATSFGWDFDGDLMSVTKGGSTVSFEYDALGRQVYRTVGSVSTNYLYDGDRIEAEWQNGSKYAQYLWGPAGLVVRNGDYPLTDGRGNTRVATNSGGTPDFYQNPDASGTE